jgi:hypothetical protein
MGNILDGRGKGGVVFLGDYVTLPTASGAPDGLLPPLGSIRFNPLIEEVEVFRDDQKNGYEWRLLNAQTFDIAKFYSKNGGPISGNMTLSSALLASAGSQNSPSISFTFSQGTGLSTAGGALRLSANGSLVATMTTNSITITPNVVGHAASFGTLNATTINAEVVSPVPFESAFFAPGAFRDGALIHRMPATHVLSFPSALAGSQAFAGVAPLSNASVTITKVGSSGVQVDVGSITWSAGNRVGLFTCPDPFTMIAGESLVFVTSNSFDDLISDISVTIAGQSIYRLDNAPTDIVLSGPQAVDEYSAPGTYVATINAIDADDTQFSYSLIGQNSKDRRFDVVGNQIVWSTLTRSTASSGWPGVYRPVTVRATDPYGKYIQKTFQILEKDAIFGVRDGDINVLGVISNMYNFGIVASVGPVSLASGENSFPVPTQEATANSFLSVLQTLTIPAIDTEGSGFVTVASANTSLVGDVLSDTGGTIENLGVAADDIDQFTSDMNFAIYTAASAGQSVDEFSIDGSANGLASSATTMALPDFTGTSSALLILTATGVDEIGPFLAAEYIGSGSNQIAAIAITSSQGYVDLIKGQSARNIGDVWSSASTTTALAQIVANTSADQFVSVTEEDTIGGLIGVSVFDNFDDTGVGLIQVSSSSVTLAPNFAATSSGEISNEARATRGIGLFSNTSSVQSLVALVGTDTVDAFTQFADQKTRGLATNSIGMFSFPVRANYASFSETLFNPSSSVNITTNAVVEPLNGAQSAARINETNDSAPDYHSVTNNSWSSGLITKTPVTFSIYGQSTGSNARGVLTRIVGSNGSSMYIAYDLTNGTVVISGASTGSFSYSTTTVTAVNGWYRISLTGNFDGPAESLSGEFYIIKPDAPQPNLYQGSVGNGISLWGAQLEYTTSPSVYLPAQGSGSSYDYILRSISQATISENITPFSIVATAHAV